jgi:Ca2+-binding RTX toxin-like protein
MKVKLLILTAVAALGFVTTASAALIRGTPGDDVLVGTPNGDLIYGGAGNDVIRGHAGNDVLYGGHGNDVMWPGAGVDVQYGGQGNDVLHALANDNQADILDCGPGFDTAIVIRNDPARFRGCEVIVRLSPDEAAALAESGDDG